LCAVTLTYSYSSVNVGRVLLGFWVCAAAQYGEIHISRFDIKIPFCHATKMIIFK